MDSAHQFAEEWTPRLDAVLMGDSFVNLLAEAFSVYAADRTAALRAANERLRSFIDFTVREWMAYDEHAQCDTSCKHRAVLDARYEAIERAILADHEGQHDIEFSTTDDPMKRGPREGDHRWMVYFPLDGNRRLVVWMGDEGMKHLEEVVQQKQADDAEGQRAGEEQRRYPEIRQ